MHWLIESKTYLSAVRPAYGPRAVVIIAENGKVVRDIWSSRTWLYINVQVKSKHKDGWPSIVLGEDYERD